MYSFRFELFLVVVDMIPSLFKSKTSGQSRAVALRVEYTVEKPIVKKVMVGATNTRCKKRAMEYPL